MSTVHLLLEVSGYKKPPKIEFNPEGLPFKLTVKHIKGMVQVETDILMKGKTIVGPDGELHADGVEWSKTGWKSGDVLRIVETPSAPSPATDAKKDPRHSSKRSPLMSGGSLLLSNLDPEPVATKSAAESLCNTNGTEGNSYNGNELEKLLASISGNSDTPTDIAHILGGSASLSHHEVLSESMRAPGKALQHADSKEQSRADVELEAEHKALQVLQAQADELTLRSEGCSMKLVRLKELLQEGREGDSLVEHWSKSDLTVPRLPALSKWNAADLMSYLQQVAVLQTQLEAWSSEVAIIAGEGLSADVLREQLPQCAAFVGMFSEFAIASIRDAAKAALFVLGESAKSVWDEWHVLPGAKSLGEIHEVKTDVSQDKPSWFAASDEINSYLDASNLEHDPGRYIRSRMKEWFGAVPFSAKKDIGDFEYYARPDSFYWKKLSIRQRAAMVFLLERAKQEDDAFHQALESALSSVSEALYKRGPVKKMERTAAKAVTDEKGDVFQIKDFHRALVVCPTPEQAVAAFHAFEHAGSHVEIVKCKNGFLNDYWGYNLKLVMISIRARGALGEVQICSSEMFRIRDMMHHYYNFARASSVDDFR